MITVIQHSTEERKKIISEKWEQYRNLYYNTTLYSDEIMKELDVSHRSEVYKYIKREIKKEKISPSKRANLIQNGRWLE